LGIAAAVIIGLAVSIHLRLSAVNLKVIKKVKRWEEVMNEILTGQPAHREANESEAGHIEESKELSHSENETSEKAEYEENR
jgi:hypothetical protein